MDSTEAAAPQGSAEDRGSGQETGQKDRRQAFDCNICFEEVVEPVVTRCGHLFCWGCLLNWINRDNDSCPVCHAGVTKENVVPLYGRGQENKDPRSKPAEPRPAAERPEPQHQGDNINAGTVFGGVAVSLFALPISVIMPFQFGGHMGLGFTNLFSMLTNTDDMSPEESAHQLRGAHNAGTDDDCLHRLGHVTAVESCAV
ncbi:zinc C3HC4 type RING finger domain-containing protein [Babesia ovata]|uniref:RING-type E3 ubiquitin transferase n=1 Tax=Babesia ovata TaxID=189622 RepID=A0A2H6K6B6_9APIC|nr:zinc C3HC4 type RING finger domain-containing protein [Babesia ovata]GBE58532.1 zinc C3HC4 type RING finger domain-containing protein [Babesia ovata]